MHLHAELAAVVIAGLALVIFRADALQNVRFSGRNLPILKNYEILFDDIVKSGQHSFVLLALVFIHGYAIVLCLFEQQLL
jgi:hypothetical protein